MSLRDLAYKIAQEEGINPDLFLRQIQAESAFDPQAKSSAGAMGLAQLMPATAKELGVSNPYDPEQSLRGGAKYMKQLLGRYNNDQTLALAAYNAGMGNVDKAGGVPNFKETQNYIAKILGGNSMIGAQAPQQMAQQEKPRGLLGGMIDRDFADQLYMAALAGSPNAQRFEPLIQSVQAGRQARREDAKEQKKLQIAQKGRNATADYLDSINQSELGNLVRQGAITGANALSAVPKPDKEKTYQYQALAADLLRTGAAKTEAEALQMALSQTKAGTTVNVGPQGEKLPPPPSGYAYRYNADRTVMFNDQGIPMVAPLAGSEADIKAKTREEKLGKTRTMEKRGQSVVSRSVQEALNILDTDTGIIPVAGTYGKFAADYLPDQEARNLKRTLEALQANTAFTRLQEMRDASQTGGALGNVSNVELGLLMSAYGSISQDLDPKLLRKNLKQIDEIMGKIESDPIASAFYNEGVDLRGSDLDKQVKSGAPSGGPKRLRFDAQGNIIND
jgi:hypothetical protein